MVTVYNATTLEIIMQYGINEYLNFSKSDCTNDPNKNFRSKVLLSAQGTYFNLNYFNDSKPNNIY